MQKHESVQKTTEETSHGTECLCCKDGPAAAANTIERFIAENRFAMVGVFDVDPPFVYTIGLTDLGLPELVLVGNFNPDEFNGLLIDIGHKFIEEVTRLKAEVNTDGTNTTDGTNNKTRIKKGSKSKSGKSKSDKGKKKINYEDVFITIKIGADEGNTIDAPVGLMTVNPFWHKRLFGQALARYGSVHCVQVFIPDPRGLLPWDSGYDEHWAVHVMQLTLYGEIDPNDELMNKLVARWCREDDAKENEEV